MAQEKKLRSVKKNEHGEIFFEKNTSESASSKEDKPDYYVDTASIEKTEEHYNKLFIGKKAKTEPEDLKKTKLSIDSDTKKTDENTTVNIDFKIKPIDSKKTVFDKTLLHKSKLISLLNGKVVGFNMEQKTFDLLMKGVPPQPKALMSNTRFLDSTDYFLPVLEGELDFILFKANVNSLELKPIYSNDDRDSGFEFFIAGASHFKNSNDVKNNLLQGNIKKFVFWKNGASEIVPVVFLKFKDDIAQQPVLLQDFLELWNTSRTIADSLFEETEIKEVLIKGNSFFEGQTIDYLYFNGNILQKSTIDKINTTKPDSYEIIMKYFQKDKINPSFAEYNEETFINSILLPLNNLKIRNLNIIESTIFLAGENKETFVLKNLFRNIDNDVYFEISDSDRNIRVVEKNKFVIDIYMLVPTKNTGDIKIEIGKVYTIGENKNIKVTGIFEALADNQKTFIRVAESILINNKPTEFFLLDDVAEMTVDDFKKQEDQKYITELTKNMLGIDIIDISSINRGVSFSGKTAYGDIAIYSEDRSNKNQAFHLYSKREFSFTLIDSNHKVLLNTIMAILVNTIRNEKIDNPDYILREIHRQIKDKGIESNVAKASFLGIKYNGGDILNCFYAGDTRFYLISDKNIFYQKKLEQNPNGIINGIASTLATPSIFNIRQDLKSEAISIKKGDDIIILSSGFHLEEDKKTEQHILKGLFYKLPVEIIIKKALDLPTENKIQLFKAIKNINVNSIQQIFRSLNINNLELKNLDDGKSFSEKLIKYYDIKASAALAFYQLIFSSRTAKKSLKSIFYQNKTGDALIIILQHFLNLLCKDETKEQKKESSDFIENYELTEIKDSFISNFSHKILKEDMEDIIKLYSIIFNEIEKLPDEVIKIIKVVFRENENKTFADYRKKLLTSLINTVKVQKAEPNRKFKDILADLKEHFLINHEELTIFTMQIERTDFKNNLLYNIKYKDQVKHDILTDKESKYIIYKPLRVVNNIEEKEPQKNIKVIFSETETKQKDILRDTVFGQNISMKELLAKEGIYLPDK